MYNKNIIQKAAFVITILFAVAFGQTVFVENFSYTANDPLTNNGWTAHSGAGTNAVRVFSPGLTYTGYASSGIGLAARVDTAGEDVNRTFAAQNSGTVYTAFMMNVQKATTTGDYWFHLSTSPLNSFEFICRTHIKRDAAGNIAIGLGKRHLDTTFTGFNYAINTTYLIVIKYQIITGDSNDRVSMFILSSGVPGTEPATPTIGPLMPVISDPAHIGSVALRQGTAANAPRVIIDGIRVATSWSAAVTGIEESALLTPTSNQLTLTVNPNPFTNFTNISFNINSQSVKNIDIYDVTGNVIQTIKSPTSNQITWNGRNSNNNLVAPGIYFVVLETNHGNKVAKALLTK